MEDVHTGNAQHAQARANVTRDEVLDALRSNGQAAAEIIRGLNEDEIMRPVPIAVMGGQEQNASEMSDMLLIGHIASHMQEIQNATAGA
jgi:hypothetical protein